MYRSVGKEGDGLEAVTWEEIALTAVRSGKLIFLLFDQNNMLVITADRYVLC